MLLSLFILLWVSVAADATYRFERGVTYDTFFSSAYVEIDTQEKLYIAPISDQYTESTPPTNGFFRCSVLPGPSPYQLKSNYLALETAAKTLGLPTENLSTLLEFVQTSPDYAFLLPLLSPPFTMFPRKVSCQDTCDYASKENCGQPKER